MRDLASSLSRRTAAFAAVGLLSAVLASGQTAPLLGVAHDVLGADFVSANPAEPPMHLVVGHTFFVNTKHRLSKVYVTNPNALYAYTATPNQVLVSAKEPGLSSLVWWDENGESEAFLFSSDVDTAVLRESLRQALPAEKVDVRAEQSKIVLSGTIGTTAVEQEAVRLAGLYSKDVSNVLLVSSGSVKQV